MYRVRRTDLENFGELTKIRIKLRRTHECDALEKLVCDSISTRDCTEKSFRTLVKEIRCSMAYTADRPCKIERLHIFEQPAFGNHESIVCYDGFSERQTVTTRLW